MLTATTALLIGSLVATPLDSYPRQPVDVEHYRFALTLADSTDRINGVATISMHVLRAGVTTVTFDLAVATPAREGRGMRVTTVSRGGVTLAFTHADDHLVITLEHPSTAGETIEFVVRYAGIPAAGLQITSWRVATPEGTAVGPSVPIIANCSTRAWTRQPPSR